MTGYELNKEQSEAIENIAKSLTGIRKELAVVAELAELQGLTDLIGRDTTLSLSERIHTAQVSVFHASDLAALIDLTKTPVPKGSE